MVKITDRQSLVSTYEEALRLDQEEKTPVAARMLIDLARCALTQQGMSFQEIQMLEGTVVGELSDRESRSLND